MNDMTEHDDINVADLMPPADPVLLASANRMLLERIEEAKTMICNAAETLEPYVGGEIDPADMDLNEIAESVALNVVELMAKLSNAQSLAEVLKRNFESKEHECEALRKSIEAAQSRGDDRPIVGMSAHAPAFPCEVDPERLEAGSHQTGHKQFQQYGMTLRDYFAAKAVQGICSTANYMNGALLDRDVAARAYKMADAMLRAREAT